MRAVSPTCRYRPYEPLAGAAAPLAPKSIACYFTAMTLAKLRRLINLLLVVALAAGFVTQGVQAADMRAKMTMTAGAMPTPHGCDGCSGDDNPCASLGGCSMTCGNILALPVANAAVDLLHAGSREPAAVLPLAGWSAPPDPHPPRPAILS
jgi:hypothetical protein